jgi:hypothetical protein
MGYEGTSQLSAPLQISDIVTDLNAGDASTYLSVSSSVTATWLGADTYTVLNLSDNDINDVYLIVDADLNYLAISLYELLNTSYL